jgi:hypothetical protein
VIINARLAPAARASVTAATGVAGWVVPRAIWHIRYTGLVLNGSDRPLEQVSITCQAMDRDGRVVDAVAGTLSTISKEEKLRPQESAPFDLQGNQHAAADGFPGQVTVQCEAAT